MNEAIAALIGLALTITFFVGSNYYSCWVDDRDRKRHAKANGKPETPPSTHVTSAAVELHRTQDILNKTTDWIREQVERTDHYVSAEGIAEHEAYKNCYQTICDITNQTQTDSTQNGETQ